MSEIITDKLTGKTAADNVTITDGSATMQLQQGLAKAYAHYDQLTTSLTVRNTLNCSSLSDDGTAAVTTNYTANLSDGYYVAGGHSGRDTATSTTAYWIWPTTKSGTITYSTSATSWQGGFSSGTSSVLTANDMFINLMTLHGDLA